MCRSAWPSGWRASRRARCQRRRAASICDNRRRRDVTSRQVAGAVTGRHRNGDLTVTDAGVGEAAHLDRARRSATSARASTLNARNGECAISESHGPRSSRGRRTCELTITDARRARSGIGGNGGRVDVDAPARRDVDDRRAAELSRSRAAIRGHLHRASRPTSRCGSRSPATAGRDRRRGDGGRSGRRFRSHAETR